MASISLQKNAIQAVASDCSTRSPPGSFAERSNTPMLSRPRKPPENSVECQVPGREPGELPLVGHGDHVVRLDVAPARVPPPAVLGRRRKEGIALEPVAHSIVVELFRPDEAGACLTKDGCVFRERHPGVEGVRFLLARGEDLVEALPERCGAGETATNEAQAKLDGPARRNRRAEVRRALRATLGMDAVGASLHQRGMEAVLHVRVLVLPAVEACVVRLVL